MDTELLAVAGFVIFLCVFGLRGLMISGAVVAALLAWTSIGVYQANTERERTVAAFDARCATLPAGDASTSLDHYLCTPDPPAR